MSPDVSMQICDKWTVFAEMLEINVRYTNKIKSSGSSVISKREQISNKDGWCTRHTLTSSNDDSVAQMHDASKMTGDWVFLKWLLGQDFLQLVAAISTEDLGRECLRQVHSMTVDITAETSLIMWFLTSFRAQQLIQTSKKNRTHHKHESKVMAQKVTCIIINILCYKHKKKLGNYTCQLQLSSLCWWRRTISTTSNTLNSLTMDLQYPMLMSTECFWS